MLKVRAEVNRGNDQALTFYKKFGFVVSKEFDSNATIVLVKTVA